jgi:hypothetical protein
MGGLLRSPPIPHGEAAQVCQALPAEWRDHVYVFLVNGFDPCNTANFAGVGEYTRQLGFRRTYFGQLYHAPWFEKEIRRIHGEDRAARFVLVGYSFGSNAVRWIAQRLKREGIAVELLAYVGGDTIRNVPEDRPENAHRIVNVTARGCVWLAGGLVWEGTDLDGAANLRLAEVTHEGVPTHGHTLAMLAENLARAAASVHEAPNPRHDRDEHSPLAARR